MKINYINQLHRDIMRDCDHTDSTQEQSILSIEDRAEIHAKKMWGSYYDSNYKELTTIDDISYGKVSKQDFLAGTNEMLPIIKELGEALVYAKSFIPKKVYGQGESYDSEVYTQIQTTLEKYKNYL